MPEGKFKLLDAGYLQKGSLVSIIQIDDRSFIHLSLPQGFMVFAVAPTTDEVAATVKDRLADFIDEGKRQAEKRKPQRKAKGN